MFGETPSRHEPLEKKRSPSNGIRKLELIRALYDFTVLRTKFNRDELFELQVYIKRLCKSLKGKSSGQKDAEGLDIRYFDPSVAVTAADWASGSATASGSAIASGFTALQAQTIRHFS